MTCHRCKRDISKYEIALKVYPVLKSGEVVPESVKYYHKECFIQEYVEEMRES